MVETLPNVALSIRQPWAWLIVNGHKDVENRDWFTRYRGPVLIHAAKAWGPDERETVTEIADEIEQLRRDATELELDGDTAQAQELWAAAKSLEQSMEIGGDVEA